MVRLALPTIQEELEVLQSEDFLIISDLMEIPCYIGP